MSIEQASEQLHECMTRWYGVRRDQVKIVFAPYRVCPLGAHIDHQLGRVTAMALDRGILLAFAPRNAPEVKLRSLDFEGEVHVRFDDVAAPRVDDWGNYVRGAILALQRDFALSEGLVGVTAGRVAEGGLSSSAAVGVAYLLALQDVNQLAVTPKQNIALVQRIENQYLGLRIGILDQSAILLSRRNALTVIDCADVTHSLIQWPTPPLPFGILVAFSGLRQSLAGTDYNQRVTECTEAARQLLQASGRPEDPPRLRSVTPQEYQAHATCLSGPPARRAQHFFSEMERVRRGVAVWNQGDVQTFGKLITESGASSIHHYECGAPPLIDLYQALIETPGVFGARFSGAGFRGCCLALIDPSRSEEIASRVMRVHARRHPELASSAWSMACNTDNGARFLESA
ncbi:MAG: galactokinase family protein [Pirellulaceae bacterium]